MHKYLHAIYYMMSWGVWILYIGGCRVAVHFRVSQIVWLLCIVQYPEVSAWCACMMSWDVWMLCIEWHPELGCELHWLKMIFVWRIFYYLVNKITTKLLQKGRTKHGPESAESRLCLFQSSQLQVGLWVFVVSDPCHCHFKTLEGTWVFSVFLLESWVIGKCCSLWTLECFLLKQSDWHFRAVGYPL